MRIIDADMLKEKKCKLCIDKHCGDGYVCGDINLINNIPTISQWIPVSERLPEDIGDEVLVQDTDGFYAIAWFDYDDKCWWCDEGYLCSYAEVIAWMPLPKPYKEGGTSEDN